MSVKKSTKKAGLTSDNVEQLKAKEVEKPATPSPVTPTRYIVIDDDDLEYGYMEDDLSLHMICVENAFIKVGASPGNDYSFRDIAHIAGRVLTTEMISKAIDRLATVLRERR